MLRPEMRDLPIRKCRRPPKRQLASDAPRSTRIIRVFSNHLIEDSSMAVAIVRLSLTLGQSWSILNSRRRKNALISPWDVGKWRQDWPE